MFNTSDSNQIAQALIKALTQAARLMNAKAQAQEWENRRNGV